MSFSQKDRVLAQIHHRETDYVPYTIHYEESVAERLDVYYGSNEWRGWIDNAIRHAIRHLPGSSVPISAAAGPYHTDRYGSTWRVDRRPFHLVEPALKKPSLDGFVLPDVEDLYPRRWKQEALCLIEQYKDYFLVVGVGFGLWERTWTLRGFDHALMDAAADPAFFNELVDQIAIHQMAIIERLLELPVDGIMFSDDWGYQRGVLLGPERWRRFLKPRLAQMYTRVHEGGKYALSHCCGSIADIMPDIIEIGLDVLESIQPEAMDMNPYELKRRYGTQITFWGGLGSQSLIPFGTPDEISAEVDRLCRELGRGGGYILSPAKPLQPETPTENAAAVVEAFLQQSDQIFL